MSKLIWGTGLFAQSGPQVTPLMVSTPTGHHHVTHWRQPKRKKQNKTSAYCLYVRSYLSYQSVAWTHNSTQHNMEKSDLCADKLLLPTDVNISLGLLQGVILAVHLLQRFQECWGWPAASKQTLCVKLPAIPLICHLTHMRVCKNRCSIKLHASGQKITPEIGLNINLWILRCILMF